MTHRHGLGTTALFVAMWLSAHSPVLALESAEVAPLDSSAAARSAIDPLALRPAEEVEAGVVVVASIPFPTDWYTRDAASGDGVLWVSENNRSRIYELDPATGAVLSYFTGPGFNPWGLAFDGVDLWNALITLSGPPPDNLKDRVYRMSTDGDRLADWLAPHSPDASPHGAAYDSTTGRLWLADSQHNTISEVDPLTGLVLSSFPAATTELRGIAFDGELLWGVDRGARALVRFDRSGNPVGRQSIGELGDDPTGLAFDGEFFWLTENETNQIYQLRVDRPCRLDVQVPRDVRAGERLRFSVELEHRRLKTVAVPFSVWVTGADDRVVATRTSGLQTMRFGEVVLLDGEIDLPVGLRPGAYRLHVGISQMQQGDALRSMRFEVVR